MIKQIFLLLVLVLVGQAQLFDVHVGRPIPAAGGGGDPTPTSRWDFDTDVTTEPDKVGSNDCTENGGPVFQTGGGQDVDGNDYWDCGAVLRPVINEAYSACMMVDKGNNLSNLRLWGNGKFAFGYGLSAQSVNVEHTDNTNELQVTVTTPTLATGLHFICMVIPAATSSHAANTLIYWDGVVRSKNTVLDTWTTTPSYSTNSLIGSTGSSINGVIHRFAVWKGTALTEANMDSICSSWSGHHSKTLTC